ncbi:histidine phosphatase family protein [Lysobacter tyrosinilyticus]
MQTIDLLRHGDTGQSGFRGQLDDALSVSGWEQMRSAVAEGQWDVVVSSPLQRCAAFAQELAAQRAIPLQRDARLSEYHFGDWQAVPLERIAQHEAAALEKFWSDPVAHPPPGAESMGTFAARISTALGAIARMPQQRVLVITHGGVIRLLHCLGRGLELRKMSSVEVPHASIHRLPSLQAAAVMSESP